ncbi:heme ABC transporter ATP-binding protein [Psychromarinibacter halotolerans]|uniref:Heme ABC transporter ATP-binding protein n=1 Tax=Psychromarinibacter halotolerans TaxID=1775175 RepID=A0ABV7GTM5_9RHOB|nr:heme ABC transporter ATP-binding protein [Psychromarinibacter halotolerans]MDF0597988.1 heme ABC transporter ATP-binding protein [Psychromarinibacter halotolerans]
MLHAVGIEVALAGTPVLKGVDFEARAGEVTVIAGPNGSGKTTLLKAMTGEVPYSGTVTLDGADVSAMKGWELAARRGVLPQAGQLSFPFTVLEILRLGLQAGRMARRTELPVTALDRVGLAGFEGRFYHDLSGGERQRVQLARVLLQVWEPVADGRPSWLLLDEPVSALDIGHQLEVMEIARDYARRGGGVVAVMHELNLTAMYADRLALLHGGRMARQGHPSEVLTDDLLSRVYGCRVRVNAVPDGPVPFVLPQAAGI